MKKIAFISLTIITIFISGCLEDDTPYLNSEYRQLDIAKLINITETGYKIQGSGEIKGDSTYFYLHFCKNNRYVYEEAGVPRRNKPYRGNYHVDLAHDSIIMTSDDLDKNGKHPQGTIYTKSGYLEQKNRVENKGLSLLLYQIDKINPSDCIKLAD